MTRTLNFRVVFLLKGGDVMAGTAAGCGLGLWVWTPKINIATQSFLGLSDNNRALNSS